MMLIALISRRTDQISTMDKANLETLEVEFRSLLSNEVARMKSMGLQSRPEDETDKTRLRLHNTYRHAQRLLIGLDSNQIPQGVDNAAVANGVAKEPDWYVTEED